MDPLKIVPVDCSAVGNHPGSHLEGSSRSRAKTSAEGPVVADQEAEVVVQTPQACTDAVWAFEPASCTNSERWAKSAVGKAEEKLVDRNPDVQKSLGHNCFECEGQASQSAWDHPAVALPGHDIPCFVVRMAMTGCDRNREKLTRTDNYHRDSRARQILGRERLETSLAMTFRKDR
jgi:hypothetical protein